MVLILGAVLMIQLAPGAHGKTKPVAERPSGTPRRREAGA
jgi:hypothetical protein